MNQFTTSAENRDALAQPGSVQGDAYAMQRCLQCQGLLPAHRRRRYCSDACRVAAWRRRHQLAPELSPLPTRVRRRDVTVYECPLCQTRSVGVQYCPDCHVFCSRVGIGGLCPHCDEPVTYEELTIP